MGLAAAAEVEQAQQPGAAFAGHSSRWPWTAGQPSHGARDAHPAGEARAWQEHPGHLGPRIPVRQGCLCAVTVTLLLGGAPTWASAFSYCFCGKL